MADKTIILMNNSGGFRIVKAATKDAALEAANRYRPGQFTKARLMPKPGTIIDNTYSAAERKRTIGYGNDGHEYTVSWLDKKPAKGNQPERWVVRPGSRYTNRKHAEATAAKWAKRGVVVVIGERFWAVGPTNALAEVFQF